VELFTKIRDFNPVEEVFGNWTPVESSNVRAYRYNAGTHVFQVQFHSGRIYGYKGVPQNVVDEFASADSKGKAVNAIKHSYPLE
jgi:KTSC domain